MFTGIISHQGVFRSYALSKREMNLEAPEDLARSLRIGESLAVDGVCLTLIRKKDKGLAFNLSPETLKQTTLGSLRRGAILNLESPLTLSSPLSGHLVTGHVDAQERVQSVRIGGTGRRISISLSDRIRPFFISKGSVSVNGVSLTVANLGPGTFEVEIIPITWTETNLQGLKTGDTVNIECDIIGKYVYNWMLREKSMT